MECQHKSQHKSQHNTTWNAQKWSDSLSLFCSVQNEIPRRAICCTYTIYCKSVKTVGVLLRFCFRSVDCLNWPSWKDAMNHWLVHNHRDVCCSFFFGSCAIYRLRPFEPFSALFYCFDWTIRFVFNKLMYFILMGLTLWAYVSLYCTVMCKSLNQMD